MSDLTNAYQHLAAHALYDQVLPILNNAKNKSHRACQYPVVLSKENTLQIHPDLFNPDLSLYRLPFLEAPPPDKWPSSWTKIAKGTFGSIYKLPWHDNPCILKLQRVEILQRSRTNSWTAPLVELETETNMYVAPQFIMEALALFTLNRYEDEHGSFLSDEQPRNCVPRMHYSAIVQIQHLYYSVILMEFLMDARTIFQLMTKDTALFFPLLEKATVLLDRMETSPLQVRHLDCHTSNFMMDKDRNLSVIDFGSVLFCMPQSYLCVLTDKPVACFNDTVPLKCNLTVPYPLGRGYYNSSVILASMDFHLKNKKNVILEQLYLKYQRLLEKLPFNGFDTMESHQANVYFSGQFETILMEYDVGGEPSTTCESSSSSSSCASWSTIEKEKFKNFSSSLIASPPSTATDPILKFISPPQFPEFLSELRTQKLTLIKATSAFNSNRSIVTQLEALDRLQAAIQRFKTFFDKPGRFLEKFGPELQLAATSGFQLDKPDIDDWYEIYDTILGLDVDWDSLHENIQQRIESAKTNTDQMIDHASIVSMTFSKLRPAFAAIDTVYDFFSLENLPAQVVQIHLWITQSRPWVKENNDDDDDAQNICIIL